MRVLELVIASRNKRIREEEIGTEIVPEKIYFLFVLLHSTFLIAVPFEVFIIPRDFNDYLGYSMFFVYLMCFLVRIHILFLLGKNWNTKIIYNSESYDSIVTNGIYKYIRHPNYLIVVLEILSLSLFHSAYYSFSIFSFFNFILLYKRINYEEQFLFKNKKYRDYFTNKKRFIPGLF